ncbi:hypothetical protein [Rhizobium laguerreae]|jgi:hypothetical protein|uniref:Uncharacterized protein n=1 Tax=Rhizobium laguerreae TaxID=1076926 RepID=A0AAX2QBV8_9HYPH|nr:hypothetical protein [Rhizobium laguerreae]TCU13231.1 hypothetical protein EV131_12842 [Rhizobium laguerreae]
MAAISKKRAYNVYYCIRNDSDGIEALAEACKPLLEHAIGAEDHRHFANKFDVPKGYGARSLRNFVAETDILDGRSADQWQQDAFGQVDAWLRALGFRR